MGCPHTHLILNACSSVKHFQCMVEVLRNTTLQHSAVPSFLKSFTVNQKSFTLYEFAYYIFTPVGLKLSHGGTAAVCWIANTTVFICNTQMDHTVCTPCIQPPNTSYRPRFLQSDHHGHTKYNLHLAAVYCNNPDRNQCTEEKSKCLS